jgi:predicted Zn-dependent protease
VPTEILCESGLEKKSIYVLLTDPNVVDVWEQPPAVAYIDLDGVRREHTFDMLVTLRNGTKYAIAVKPAEIAKKHDLKAKLTHIAAQVPRNFADFVDFFTEEKGLTRDAVHDALLIHSVRRNASRDADETLKAIVATLSGTVSVRMLVAASGLEGQGFRAVVRLIDEGTLRIVGRRRIGYDTIVARATSNLGRLP